MNSLSPRGYVPQELPFASEEAIPQKVCKKCDKPFPATEKFFRVTKNNTLRPQCRECGNAVTRERRKTPEYHEHKRAYDKNYYQSHPEYREYMRIYGKTRQESPEKREQILAQKRTYYRRPERQARVKVYQNLPEVRQRKRVHDAKYRNRSENRERRQRYMQAYYQRPEVREQQRIYRQQPRYRNYRREYSRVHNKTYLSRPEVRERIRVREKIRRQRPEVREYYKTQARKYRSRPEIRERLQAYQHIYRKNYYVENREHLINSSRTYYLNNRQHALDFQKEYNKRPEVRERNHIRREITRSYKKSTKGKYTVAQIQDLLKRQRYGCYYCRHKLEKKQGKYIYHIDHTFPISRSKDSDDPINDISYLVIACPTCNLKKGNKFPHEFYEGGRLL